MSLLHMEGNHPHWPLFFPFLTPEVSRVYCFAGNCSRGNHAARPCVYIYIYIYIYVTKLMILCAAYIFFKVDLYVAQVPPE